MLHAPNVREWSHHESMLDWHHTIAPDGYRLPPGGMVIPADFRVYLGPPFDRQFVYEISFGCLGSPVFRIVKTVSMDDLTNAYSTFLSTDRGRDAGHKFAMAVFGVDEGTEEYSEGFD
jgi:hypothetical protein